MRDSDLTLSLSCTDAVSDLRRRIGGRPRRVDLAVYRWDGARANVGQVADALTRRHGYTPLEWQPVERWWAAEVILRVLSQGLAYSSTCYRDNQEARRLADTFLALFAEGSAFVSNGDTQERPSDMSRGTISEATFDTGVIAVDAETVGILWVMDED